MPADYQNRTQSGKGCSGLEFNLYAFVSVKLLCRHSQSKFTILPNCPIEFL